jgi:hypothetical protein
MFDTRQILVISYKLFDLLVMIFSFALATWITFHDQAAELFSFGDFHGHADQGPELSFVYWS